MVCFLFFSAPLSSTMIISQIFHDGWSDEYVLVELFRLNYQGKNIYWNTGKSWSSYLLNSIVLRLFLRLYFWIYSFRWIQSDGVSLWERGGGILQEPFEGKNIIVSCSNGFPMDNYVTTLIDTESNTRVVITSFQESNIHNRLSLWKLTCSAFLNDWLKGNIGSGTHQSKQ